MEGDGGALPLSRVGFGGLEDFFDDVHREGLVAGKASENAPVVRVPGGFVRRTPRLPVQPEGFNQVFDFHEGLLTDRLNAGEEVKG